MGAVSGFTGPKLKVCGCATTNIKELIYVFIFLNLHFCREGQSTDRQTDRGFLFTDSLHRCPRARDGLERELGMQSRALMWVAGT